MNDGCGKRTLQRIRINLRHNVVADDFFAFVCNVKVKVRHVLFQFFDLSVGDTEPEFLFGFGKRNPKSAP